jgi:hypothetical protein
MTKHTVGISIDEHTDVVIIGEMDEYSFPIEAEDIPTNNTIKQHFALILDAIEHRENRKLEELLTANMQCSPIKSWTKPYTDGIDGAETPRTFAAIDSGRHEMPSMFYMDICPVVEGLARLYPYTYFPEMVNALYKTNSMQLHDAFVRSLDSTRGILTERNLFMWETPLKNAKGEMEKGIAAINQHGLDLLNKKDPDSTTKGDIAVKLAGDLTKKLATYVSNEHVGEAVFMKNLRLLNFKLEFNILLHSKDDELNRHRGYAKIISNLFSILFTGGLLNVVNYVRKGTFFFYDKTASQERVENLERTLQPIPISLRA